MTDNVCYSILKTATEQIIQSAGFEAAGSHAIDTLTDVFCNYIQLLGSTVSAYAQLNGRTMGNARDLMEALHEASIDPDTLKSWFDEDGKALTPSWSAQSDPGRLLQGKV
jgi:histone H3/H4